MCTVQTHATVDGMPSDSKNIKDTRFTVLLSDKDISHMTALAERTGIKTRSDIIRFALAELARSMGCLPERTE